MTNSELNRFKQIKKDIEKLNTDFYKISRKPHPYFLAVRGEMLACIKLLENKKIRKRFKIHYKGGSSRSDIELVSKTENDSKIINIDVKTSSYKNESDDFGVGFGWGLKRKKCKNHNIKKGDFCYFDYLLLVGIDKKNKIRLFVLSRDEIKNAPKVESKRFHGYDKRIVLPFENENSKHIKKWDKNFKKNLNEHENALDKIVNGLVINDKK